MSDERKKLEKEISLKQYRILSDKDTSDLIKVTISDLIANAYKLSSKVVQLEEKIEDIQQSLNDNEAHDMR